MKPRLDDDIEPTLAAFVIIAAIIFALARFL